MVKEGGGVGEVAGGLAGFFRSWRWGGGDRRDLGVGGCGVSEGGEIA